MGLFDSYAFTTQQAAQGPDQAQGKPGRRDRREETFTAPKGIAAGSLGYSSGGPAYLDAYHSKRSPTPPELVNAWKNISYACVGLNAKGMAKVPLRLYAKTSQGQKKPRRSWRPVDDRRQKYLRGIGDRCHPTLSRSIGTHDEVDEIVDHPLLQAIESPNAYFDKQLFLQFIAASLDVIGQVFLYPVRPIGPDGLSDPGWACSEIWPLQSQYVFPAKATDGRLIDSWKYFSDTFATKELCRIRHLSLRDPYLSGYAPMHACYEQSGLVDYYTASIEGILKGGGRPDAILSAKDNLMPIGSDEAERLENEINQKYGGPNQGRIWVMRGAFDLNEISYSPVDLGGLELTRHQRLLAANCFDVPIDMLESENSNRATASESTHKHQYYAIAPRCAMADGAITHQIAQKVDLRLFVAFDDPVTRDVEQAAKIFDMKIKNGSATINEARADDGLAAVPWGDVPPSSAGVATAHGEPDGDEADSKPAEASAKGKLGQAAGDDVQKQALNGAQITSMVEVVTSVATGVIPPSSAAAILAAAFPSLTPDQVSAIIDPVEVKEPPEPASVPAALKPKPGRVEVEPVNEPPDPEPDPEADDPDTPKALDPERSALYGRMHRVLETLEDRLVERDRSPGPGGDGDRGNVVAENPPK